MNRIVYRRPLGVLALLALILITLTLVMPGADWTFVVLFLLFFGLIASRQRLVCTPEGVEVTFLRTQRIPWAQVRGFQAASNWRGGAYVLTTSGRVWSAAPGSWWGGPASDADLAALEGARPRV